MKKIFLAALLTVGAMGAFAQATEGSSEVLTKKGYKILPEAGDFALGIDATPFLEYAGNFFNGNLGNDAPEFGFGENGVVLYGKYFLEDNRAIRARLRVNTGKNVFKGTVQDDYKVKLPEYAGQDPTVVDVMERSSTRIDLTVGYEFRRGYRRLQGFYGGELGFGVRSGNKDTYTWANAITEANQTPTTTNGLGVVIPPVGAAYYRPTVVNNGNRFNIFANAFVGVEYFVASKISIGGELMLSLNAYNVGQTETTAEGWVADQGVVKNTVRNRAGQSGAFRFQTQPTGNIFVMFHF